MNENFLIGFVKAAKDAGMDDAKIQELLAQHGGEEAHEAAPHHEGGIPHEEELEEMLSQLSPEELEHLLAEVAQEQQGTGHSEEAEQIPNVAAGIEQQLSQHPEVAEQLAPHPGADEATLGKQSAINFIKSASYVEGFLTQAVGRGIGLKEAVELYDSAFTTTFNQLKQSELVGGQKKLDVNHNGKIDAEDLKKLREHKASPAGENKSMDSEEKKAEKECECGGTCDECKSKKEKEKQEEKTAAYYEGVLERAREYGLSDAEALQVVKEAMEKESGLAETAGSAVTNTLRRGATALKDVYSDTKDLVKKHPKKAIGLGAASVGGAGIVAGRESKE